MTIHIDATYHDGVLHPQQPLALPEGINVRVAIETPAPAAGLAFPPSVVEQAAVQDPQERIRAFEAWVASHRDVAAIADDSRDGIY